MTTVGGPPLGEPLEEASLRAILHRLSQQNVTLTPEAEAVFGQLIARGNQRLREQRIGAPNEDPLQNLTRLVDAVADAAHSQGVEVMHEMSIRDILRRLCPIDPWC